MSPWVIEWFGGNRLQEAFLWITLLPLPAWFLLLFAQRKPWMRRIAHPLVLPLFPIPLWAYVLFQVFVSLGSPAPVDATYAQTRAFLSHPLIFLALWAQLQVVNLFVATVIYQEGRRTGTRVTVEILLAWLLAPLALAVCALHLGTKRTFLR